MFSLPSVAGTVKSKCDGYNVIVSQCRGRRVKIVKCDAVFCVLVNHIISKVQRQSRDPTFWAFSTDAFRCSMLVIMS